MSGADGGRRRVRWSALVLVVCLAGVVACGDDEGPAAADLVEASLVRGADLPDEMDWQVGDGESDPALDEGSEECERRHDPTLDVAEAEQESETFEWGVATISSTGWVVRDQEKREQFFDQLDEQVACVGEVLARYFREQAGEDSATVEVESPYAIDVDVDADLSGGRTLQIGVEQPGAGAGTLYLDVLAVAEGDLMAGYFFLHGGQVTLEQQAATITRCLDRVRGVAG